MESCQVSLLWPFLLAATLIFTIYLVSRTISIPPKNVSSLSVYSSIVYFSTTTTLTHILLLQLPRSSLSVLPFQTYKYPINQFLFLISLTISMIIRNKVNQYFKTIALILYMCIVCLYVFDLVHLTIDLQYSVTFAKFIRLIVVVIEGCVVLAGITLLLHRHQRRAINSNKSMNGKPNKNKQDQVYQTITYICIGSVILAIIFYIFWLYKAQIYRSYLPYQSVPAFPSLGRSSLTRSRRNIHGRLLRCPSKNQVYIWYWVISSIVNGTVLGLQFQTILEPFSDEDQLGQKKKCEEYTEINNIQLPQLTDHNNRQNLDDGINQQYQKLMNYTTNKSANTHEQQKKTKYKVIIVSFIFITMRWAAEYLNI